MVLPLVLVVAVVLGVVVVALATYASTNLKYGGVVEERADRLAAADGGHPLRGRTNSRQLQSTCTTNLGNGSGDLSEPRPTPARSCSTPGERAIACC